MEVCREGLCLDGPVSGYHPGGTAVSATPRSGSHRRTSTPAPGAPPSTTTCGRFWQRESYDHVVKQEREMERLVACIENNPVKAGLVAGRLERRSRPGLRAEARSGTLKRAPQ